MFFLGLGASLASDALGGGAEISPRPGTKASYCFSFVSKAFLLVGGVAPCPGSSDWSQRGACFCRPTSASHLLTLLAWWPLKGLRGLVQDLGKFSLQPPAWGRIYLQASGPGPKHLYPAGNLTGDKTNSFSQSVCSGNLIAPAFHGYSGPSSACGLRLILYDPWCPERPQAWTLVVSPGKSQNVTTLSREFPEPASPYFLSSSCLKAWAGLMLGHQAFQVRVTRACAVRMQGRYVLFQARCAGTMKTGR